MQKRSLCHFLPKRVDSLFALLAKGRANVLVLIMAAFLLQNCSYSAPNPGDNILGKSARQETTAKTPRRAPVGNVDSVSENATSSASSAKKANSDYDAYQHYQAANPPKKTKRRPILNLNELNGIMDNEAAAIDAAHSAQTPSIDAESDLNQVIAHNKAKKKTQKKKKAKLLVIKKKKAIIAAPVACAAPAPIKPKPILAPAAIKALAKAAIIAPSKSSGEAIIPAVTSKPATVNASMMPAAAASKAAVNLPITAPAAPTNNMNDNNLYSSVPVVAPPVVNDINLPITETAPKSVAPVAPIVSIPPAAPANPSAASEAPPVTNNNISTSGLLPHLEVPSSAAPLDIKNMSQQDIEEAVKNKFNNGQGKGLLDNAITNSKTDNVNVQSAPVNNNAPMPMLPSSMSNITESSFSSRLSNLNDLLIKYYFSIKSFLLSFFSFAD